jgi:hypothetical protein
MTKVRLGPWFLSAVVYFALGAVWFTVFREPWLAGVGKTMEQLQQQGSAGIAYAVAFLANLAIAYVLARVIATGKQSLATGVSWGAVLGIGIALAAMVTESAFEARGVSFMLISAGYPVVGMIIMGAILGGWKTKAAPAVHQ